MTDRTIRGPENTGQPIDGGPTDMHNLCGLCVPCHHLIHAGLLTCRRDDDGTLIFTTANGTTIDDRRRQVLDDLQRRIA